MSHILRYRSRSLTQCVIGLDYSHNSLPVSITYTIRCRSRSRTQCATGLDRLYHALPVPITHTTLYRYRSLTQCVTVLCKFTCSWDTNVTYIGVAIRYLKVGVEEHFTFKKGFVNRETHRNTLMFANHARVTNIFLTVFQFLKHATFNTAQKSKKRYQQKSIIQNLTRSNMPMVLFC